MSTSRQAILLRSLQNLQNRWDLLNIGSLSNRPIYALDCLDLMVTFQYDDFLKLLNWNLREIIKTILFLKKTGIYIIRRQLNKEIDKRIKHSEEMSILDNIDYDYFTSIDVIPLDDFPLNEYKQWYSSCSTSGLYGMYVRNKKEIGRIITLYTAGKISIVNSPYNVNKLAKHTPFYLKRLKIQYKNWDDGQDFLDGLIYYLQNNGNASVMPDRAPVA